MKEVDEVCKAENVEPNPALILFIKSFFEGFEELPFGIIVVDRQANIRFFNSLFEKFIGVQSFQAIGKPIRDIFSRTQTVETLASGATLNNKYLLNGLALECSSFPVMINGKVIFAIEMLKDCSDKMSISNELAELREKHIFLSLILDETFEELIAVDKIGRLTYISPKSAQNFGFLPDEILGKDITTFDLKCSLKKVAQTGISEFNKISRPNKDPVPVMATPIFNGDELCGSVCRSIFTDMAEAKRFISHLEKSDGALKKTPCPRKISGCKFSFDDIIGNSKAISYIKEKAIRVAEGDSTVLITGESGTGKELFAQAIHMASLRRNGPFIRVNCASIPENLLESELFGYEPGSFTGARKGGKPGKFELAHNGTIFLDEVGDMSMWMQAKLLRVFQEGEIARVGGTVSYEVDVRIISATNKDLWKMVEKGRFREDFYYRLDVVNLQIPPLRERTEDISLLIDEFIPIINKRANCRISSVSKEVLDCFLSYRWPGNVRELINVLEGAMILNNGDSINLQAFPVRIRKKISGTAAVSLKFVNPEDRSKIIKQQVISEKALIEQALMVKNGNKRQAAIYLNMCRSTFYNKLRKYEINVQSSLNH